MKPPLLPAALLLSIPLGACRTPDYGRPLPEGWPALLPLAPGEARPDFARQWRERDEIAPALERSIEWTGGAHARAFFPMEGISHERALQSLVRFREILEESASAAEFDRRIGEEFTVYKSAGWDGRGGGVLFTGYYTPILKGREQREGEYHHPLFALPPDLVKGPQGEILGRRTAAGLEPYPARRAIEASGMLADQGLELIWLRSALDVFIAHVNGSAFVELPDGRMRRFGYSGKNGRAYTSLGKELVKDGELRADEVSLQTIRAWADAHPGEIDAYLDRNESYVFFTPIDGNPRGSLNVEVSAGRSLATDKTLFPRGALVYVDTKLPSGERGKAVYRRFMLDQDTGGAIRTAGRADIYLGIGPEAEEVAGRTRAEGHLYYLFLAEEPLSRRAAAP